MPKAALPNVVEVPRSSAATLETGSKPPRAATGPIGMNTVLESFWGNILTKIALTTARVMRRLSRERKMDAF